jgi:hypothetical protein
LEEKADVSELLYDGTYGTALLMDLSWFSPDSHLMLLLKSRPAVYYMIGRYLVLSHLEP